MSLQSAVRALADTLAPPPQASKDLAFATGEITANTAGVLTVLTLGEETQAPYYGDTPAVGAKVDVLIVDGSPRILGVPKGAPPTDPTP